MNTARGSLAKLKTRLGELSVTTEQQQAKQPVQQALRTSAPVYLEAEEPLLSPRSQQADRDAKQALLEVCHACFATSAQSDWGCSFMKAFVARMPSTLRIWGYRAWMTSTKIRRPMLCGWSWPGSPYSIHRRSLMRPQTPRLPSWM